MKADQTLDTSGLCCPVPILKTKGAVEKMATGQILEVIATDAGAKADIPAWCKRTGNELVETGEAGGKLLFYVKKVK